MERYKRAAAASGYTLAEFLRAAADSAADVVEGVVTVATAEERFVSLAPVKRQVKGRGKSAPRKAICEHRVPPTAFCKRCD